MICITGAGGTVGSEVVKQLLTSGARFRVTYFSPDKAKRASASGLDAVVIDYGRPETLLTAFAGCDKLFLLGPTVPDQTRLELNAVNAASASGVQHIVKQSVLGAEESYSLAEIHRPVECAIESSGMAWTHLRPNSFMQNVETFMSPTINAENAFFSASEDAKISHVDVRDIAATAVKALTAQGYENKAYTLTGPEALSYDELALGLSSALGRTIVHVSLPPADLKQAMAAGGTPDEIADRLLDLERYFRSGRASGISNDIEQITGRPARRLQDYITEVCASGALDTSTD